MQLADLLHLFTVALNPQRLNQLQGAILFKNMQYYRVENWVVLLVMCVSDYHMLSSLKIAVMNNYYLLSSLKTAVMNNYHMLSSLKTAVLNNYSMLCSLKTAVMNNYSMLSSLKTAVQSKDGVLFFFFLLFLKCSPVKECSPFILVVSAWTSRQNIQTEMELHLFGLHCTAGTSNDMQLWPQRHSSVVLLL